MTYQQPTLGLEAETIQQQTAVTSDRRVVVRVTMPHLARYGRETVKELTYAVKGGDVAIGDIVVVPPTRLSKQWLRGRVVRFDDGGYTGYVRHCKVIVRNRHNSRVWDEAVQRDLVYQAQYEQA